MGDGINVDDRYTAVYESFFFKEPHDLFARIDGLCLQNQDFNELKCLFRQNMSAAIDIGSLPFLMASTAVSNLSFNRMLTAERIRQLRPPPEDHLLAEHEEIAHSIASEKHQDFIASHEGVNYLRIGVLNDLRDALGTPEFARASAELLREFIVMIWGAFEALTSDLFRSMLNNRPDLAAVVIKAVRWAFSANVSIEELAAHDFNLHAQMGNYLLRDRGLDSLPMMRECFKAILPTDVELQKMLGEKDIWLLWQRRHLIAHRRGIIDDGYLQKTGDVNQHKGERLNIPSGYIDPILFKITNIATMMLKSADDALLS